MGDLSHFDLERLVKQYGCPIFVETGTGVGKSLELAHDSAWFWELYSIEIFPALYRIAAQKFAKRDNVYLLHGSSREALPKVLDLIKTVNPNDRVMFWLDAHFPGADYGLYGYQWENDTEIRMPLHRELQIIQDMRDGAAEDVILIDDARLFGDADFEKGTLPVEYRGAIPDELFGTGWIEKMWGKTHDIVVDLADEGYYILTPKRNIRR